MKATLLIVFVLSLLSSESARAFGKKPVNVPPHPAPAPAPTPPPPSPSPKPIPMEATCPAVGAMQAVDLSEPVNQHFLDVMKQLKIQTVVRYYDHTNETIQGKTLKATEVDLLARNGFDLMVVFQHNNNNIASFTSARGTADASRSLDLAAQNKQSKGSAIYFGVDGSWSSLNELASIKTYFTKAGAIVRAGGFKVGAYGSGLVCRQLLDAGLVDFCWLANATGWPDYTKFKTTKEWTMVQQVPKDCGGINVDFNVVSATKQDIGQFRP